MLRALGLVGGKYRLEEELGRGATGAVYAARGPAGELVAVKLLTRLEPVALERFVREAQLLVATPPHPNVVRVLDSGKHGELPFLVLEHVPGGSLAKALEGGRWPARAAAVALVARVLGALAHLHRSGVVHRDVNANNVLLDAAGEPRLVDFGLALDLERITRLTQTNDVLGTAHGIAPEQLDGRSGPATDVYAAGALLYTLLARRPPFAQVRTFRELTKALRNEDPPALDALDASLPRELAKLVASALAKSPESRPSAEALASALSARSAPSLALPRFAGEGAAPSPAQRGRVGEGARRFLLRGGRVANVVAELARGGSAVVYRAKTADGADLAVKVLVREGLAALARFEREARLQRALGEKEGFVPLVETGTSDEGPFIVMPYYPSTLAARLEKGRLGVTEAVAVARDVAAALGRAHAVGVVHRDVKPSNVLFGRDGRPLLADLGIAKHYRDDVPGASQSVALSGSGELRGSPGYLAPEQARDARTVTPAADVFALGAMLHECLVGRPPFEGGTLLAAIERAERGELEPPRSACPEVPAWLDALVVRCLAPDPADRPRDGAALAKLLAAPSAPRGRRIAIVAALWTAALVTIGVALVGRKPPPVPTPPPPVEPTTGSLDERAALPEPWRSAPSRTGHIRLRAVLGTYWLHHRYGPDIVKVVPGCGYAVVTGGERAWLWDLNGQREVCSLPSRGGPVRAIAVARDGLSAVTATERRQPGGLYAPDPGEPPGLHVWELPKGELARRIETNGRVYASVALTPRGEKLIAAGDGTIAVFDASSGRRERELPAPGVEDVALDASGELLLVRSAKRLRLIDWKTGAVRHEIAKETTCAALSRDAKRVATGDAKGEVALLAWGGPAQPGIHALEEPVAAIALDAKARVWSAGATAASAISVARFAPAREARTITIPSRAATPRTRDDLRVAFDPERARALVSGVGTTLRVLRFDEREHAEIDDVTPPDSNVLALAVSPDGKLLASGTEHGLVQLWDAATGAFVRQVRAGQRLRRDDGSLTEPAIWALAFTPSGEELVTTSRDGRLRVLATRGLVDVHDPYPAKRPLGMLAVSPRGDAALTATRDGESGHETQLWRRLRDARAFYEVPDVIAGSSPSLFHAAFLGPDFRRAVVARDRTTLEVVAVPSLKPVVALGGHTDDVFDVAASASGERVLTCSHGGEVFVWDLATKSPAPRACRGHEGCVCSVLISKDGKRGVSTGRDGFIRLWDLDHAEEIEAFSLAPAGDVAWSLAKLPDDSGFFAGTERGVILRFEWLR